MDKIMALVSTNNQIIAVPIKSITTNSKIQLNTTSTTQSSIAPANQLSTTSTGSLINSTSTITIPNSIKTIKSIQTLPTGLKIANNLLSIQKTGVPQASSSTNVKPRATYLICSKNNILTDLTKLDESKSAAKIDSDKQLKESSSVPNQILTIQSNAQRSLTQLFNQSLNPIIITQTTIAQSKTTSSDSNNQSEKVIDRTTCESKPTEFKIQHVDQSTLIEKMDVEVQNKTKFHTHLEPIREEIELNRREDCDDMEVISQNDTTTRTSNDIEENEIKIKEDDLESLSSPDSDFDPVEALNWSKDVGTLPGTSLQFILNEYGCLELLTNKEADEIRKNNNQSNLMVDDHHLPNGGVPSDDLYSVCLTCGVKQLKKSFIRKGRFCSQNCATFQSSQLRNLKNSSILDDRFSLNKFASSKTYNQNKSQQQQLRNRKLGFEHYEQPDRLPPMMKGHEEVDDFNTKVKENFIQDKFFSWKKYLIQTRSLSAPLKCFKSNQIYNERHNFFRPSMKLEAIDPMHPSLFCVATVVEVIGSRLRIHFDKYSSVFDFWVNCDSPFIFDAGFCSRTNRKLQPPKNYDQFDWSTYLVAEKAKAAPRHCFYWQSKQQSDYSLPSGFKIGLKLEAVDKANSSLVCVATIADIIGDWLLIHFDGWDSSYDYWADYTSPYIHPTNWCKTKGKALTPPKDYPKATFNWPEYLEETKSMCVPSSAFRVRPVNTFKPSMKLEVVDKRNPRYIRVETVIARGSYSIKINFDNWDEKYDFWIDDDSPNIHPVNWCYLTKNYIEHPPLPYYDKSSYYLRCPIFGCKSFGHVHNPNLLFHESIDDCPYSEDNMDYELPDRFGDSSELSSENSYMNDESDIPSPNSDSISLSTLNEKVNFSPAKLVNKSKNLYNSYTLECFDMYNSDSERMSHCSSPNSELNMLPIRQSIIDIKTSFLQMEEPLLHWDKNTKHLVSYVNALKAEDVFDWDCDRVGEFVTSIPVCSEYASKFKEQSIDGESLLLLTQSDLIKILGIKLGSALKIYNCILILRRRVCGELTP